MSKRFSRLFFLILGIALLAVLIDAPGNPGLHLNLGGLHINRDFPTRLGLDLVGGVQALLEADLPSDQVVSPDAMKAARDIIENRVNGLGVSEAVVQQAGDRRILVELPGETDPQKALATVEKTGLLEFVDFSSLSSAEAFALEGQTVRTDFAQSEPITTTGTITSTAGGPADRIFHTVMTGAGLKDAASTRDRTTGQFMVQFELNADGAKTFKDFTTKNVGKPLAIVLDKTVISAPNIQSPITDGKGVIQGNFTLESANHLSVQLRYGALPVPLKVANSQTVGPTLGQSSLQKSLVAGAIGLTVVVLFMALYYRLPGLVADVALILYSLFTLALFKLIPVTLTLPGIAGFVLSIGMAVDANILIFERMKEELRAGKPLRLAIDQGWARAWPSIRDANLSTLITCFILFWFGNAFGASIVKGFSLTLATGVLVSMFTAITVTRTFLHAVLDRVQFTQHHAWFGI